MSNIIYFVPNKKPLKMRWSFCNDWYTINYSDIDRIIELISYSEEEMSFEIKLNR